MKVFVRGLRLEAAIGLYDHERGRTQTLTVDMELTLRVRGVQRLTQTVNYEELVAAARTLAAAGHIDLVETFAEQLAHAILEHPLARQARVRVEKPSAIEGAAAAGVEVSRAKGGTAGPA